MKDGYPVVPTVRLQPACSSYLVPTNSFYYTYYDNHTIHLTHRHSEVPDFVQGVHAVMLSVPTLMKSPRIQPLSVRSPTCPYHGGDQMTFQRLLTGTECDLMRRVWQSG
jgi:hypothetical protein